MGKVKRDGNGERDDGRDILSAGETERERERVKDVIV